MMFHLPNPHGALHPLRSLRAWWSAQDTIDVPGASFCDACGSICDDGCRRDVLHAQHDHLLLRAGLGSR